MGIDLRRDIETLDGRDPTRCARQISTTTGGGNSDRLVTFVFTAFGILKYGGGIPQLTEFNPALSSVSRGFLMQKCSCF